MAGARAVAFPLPPKSRRQPYRSRPARFHKGHRPSSVAHPNSAQLTSVRTHLKRPLQAGESFAAFAAAESKRGVRFHANLDDVPPTTGKKLALIAGRTGGEQQTIHHHVASCLVTWSYSPFTIPDNPRLLKEVIAKGCTHIYLEKPGESLLATRDPDPSPDLTTHIICRAE